MKLSTQGILMLLFLVFSFSTKSQRGQNDWTSAMDNPAANFYDIQKAFYSHWEGKTIEKGKGYKQFKRWEAYMEPRVYPSGNLTLPSLNYENFLKWEEQSSLGSLTRSSAGTWSPLGPIGTPSGGGAGRLNFVRFDPTDNSIIYVGAPDGGLWKSTNSGTSWTTNTDQLTVIGCSDIAINATNPQVMYLATGDGDAGDSYSIGVLKSTDGGATWNPSGLTWTASQGRLIRKLIINPNDPTIIIAATSNGMYRTADSGATWTQVQASIGYYDVEFKPGDPNVVYGSGTRVYKSTNGGVSWTQLTSGVPNSDVERIAIEVTEANPNYVYLLAGRSSDQGLLGVYRSTNSGTSFTLVKGPTGPNLLGWDTNGGDSGGQAFYDLAFAVSPFDEDELIVGGVNVWRSTNGGTSWNMVAHWYGGGGNPYVHADHHFIGFLPGSATTYFTACDGGLYKTTNSGNSWTDLSANLTIAQQYRLSLSASSEGLLIAGHQDNGINKLNAGSWSEIKGGDGMDCFIDRTNNNIMYGSYVYGDYARSTNGGNNWTSINSGIPTGSGSADWLSVWHQDPVSSTTLYAGGREDFYRTTNSGSNWSSIGTPPGSANIVEFAIAPSNNQIVYAIKRNAISKSTNGGVSWTNVTGSIPTSAYFTNLAVHSTDPNIVWMTVSGYIDGNKVYKTIDGGANWTNVSTGLPNVPCNTIVFQDGSGDDPVYVGTDIGVFYLDNNAGTWVSFFDGLPRTSVRDLEIYYPTGKLRAATFGRGTWESTLFTPGSFPPVAEFSGAQNTCEGTSVVFSDASAFAPTSWNWVVSPGAMGVDWSFVNSTSSSSQNPEIQFITAGTYSIELTATNGSGSNTMTKTDYIAVIGNTTIDLPIIEDFETTTFPPVDWEIVNSNASATWERTTDAAFSTTPIASMVIDNYTNDDRGDQDEIRLPKADFSSLIDAQISFDVAYAPYDENYFDGLEIAVSTDCGGTFTTVFTKSNLVLATAPTINAMFTPTNSEWRSESVDLSAYIGIDGVLIAFRNVAGYGNRIFIDNINVTGNVSSTPPVANFSTTNTTVCAGESISFSNSTSGTSPTYSWSFVGGNPSSSTDENPTITYDTAGDYTVELTATNGLGTNTMTQTDYITVSIVPPVPTISESGSTTICEGENVVLTSSSSINNSWSSSETTQSITVTETGGYSVTVSEGACSSTSMLSSITVNALPNVTMTDIGFVCEGWDSFELSGGSPVGGTYSGNGVVSNDFNASSAGIGTHPITYTYVDGNSCEGASTGSVTVDVCLDLSELNNDQMQVYPNPSTGILYINSGGVHVLNVDVLDNTGRIIFSIEGFDSEVHSVDLSELVQGSYTIRLVGENQIFNTSIILLK
jgi:PKD repeat protein